MNRISSYSYWGLLVVALMSFIFLIAFKADFYNYKFQPKMGIWGYRWGYFLAILVESARFWFILASSNDKIRNNTSGFRLGILMSLAAVGYDWQVCAQMGTYYDANSMFFTNVFRSVVMVGLAIEIRLSWMLSEETPAAAVEQKTETAAFDISKFSKEVQEAYLLEKLKNLDKTEKK